MTLARRLQEVALEAGFDRVGWAPARPFTEEYLVARRRQRAGLYPPFAPEPGWAADMDSIMPAARSFFLVARGYRAQPDPPVPPGRGWIARFARGPDYHGEVKARLAPVVAVLQQERPGVANRIFVDTAPVWDKAAAARAGLGAPGRNTLIMVPGLGSWAVLGGLLLEEPLGQNEPLPSPCGSCRACLEACPTGALLAPGRLDYRRCLSWLTQKSGVIPRNWRRLLGPRLYGCDDCQEACPQNRWTAPRQPDHPDPGAYPWLRDILALDRPGFAAHWSHTALGWRGLTVLQRNALIAAGNSGDRALVPAALPFLQAAQPLLRQHAAWALGCLGGYRAGDGLRRALAQEPHEEVRQELTLALESG